MALQRLCRICGRLCCSTKKKKVAYKCEKYTEDLNNTFTIATMHDDPNIHPPNFCHSCKCTMINVKAGKISVPTLPLIHWQPHNHGCLTCNRVKNLSKGGRPDRSRIGRPGACSRRAALTRVHSIAPVKYGIRESAVYSTLRTPPQYGVTLEDLTCCICLNILDQPMELSTCKSVICAGCLTTWLTVCPDCLTCPCCYHSLQDLSTIQPASNVLQKLIGGLQLSCTCGATVTFETYESHRKEGCNHKCSTHGEMSVHNIIMQPVDSPLSPIERELQTSLARRSLAGSNGENIIRMKTGGQV